MYCKIDVVYMNYFFDMYINFYNYITFNNLIHKQHVRYILKIIETI